MCFGGWWIRFDTWQVGVGSGGCFALLVAECTDFTSDPTLFLYPKDCTTESKLTAFASCEDQVQVYLKPIGTTNIG